MSNENKKTSGVVSLQNIVYNVLNDEGIYSKENFKRYLQWVIRGFTQLNLYNMRTLEVVTLDMSDTGVVTLPDDYIDYTKIGICVNGTILTLGLNNDLCLPRTQLCAEDVNSNFNAVNVASYGGYYFGASSWGKGASPTIFGYTGGFAESYYRIDTELRQIQFSSAVDRGEIILEYLSSGVSITGNTYIPRQAVEALIAFCHWQRVKFDPKISAAKLSMIKQDYIEEENKLTFFENVPTMQEIQDALYETWQQGVKR